MVIWEHDVEIGSPDRSMSMFFCDGIELFVRGSFLTFTLKSLVGSNWVVNSG